MVKKIKDDSNFFEDLKENFPEVLIEENDEDIEFLSTGILSLDVSLGTGGIPKGRFTEIYGIESSGKTTLALQICKQSLLRGDNILYLDVEQTTDIERIKDICEDAYDKTRFTFLKPRLMEDTLRICEVGIDSGKFSTIVVDSLAAMTPKKVMDDDLFDANVAILARIIKAFLQRNKFGVRTHKVAFIGINQVSSKIGMFVSSVPDAPEWHAWRHITSVRLELKRPSQITVGTDKDKEIVGVSIPYVIKKNKLAPPFRSYYFPIMFPEGKIDIYEDVVDFALTCGILVKGGGYYKLEDVSLAHGRPEILELLKNDTKLLDKIRKLCYNAVITRTKELDDGIEQGTENEENLLSG